MTNENPFHYEMENHHRYYERKMKRFLTAVALGMTPAKLWNGIYDANGGYLVVKETGDIICYHIYNKKEFESYLYVNTRLENPTRNRYHHGSIEERGDDQIFKLNLQVRFIK